MHNLSRVVTSRGFTVLSAFFYAYAIGYAHANYLSLEYGYLGFSYRAPELFELLLMSWLLVVGSSLLPVMLTRPSSIVVILLFVVVYVPTTVITLCLDTDRLARYGPGLVLLAVAFASACVGARLRARAPVRGGTAPGGGFGLVMLSLWVAGCAVLIHTYHSIMSFVGLDRIYDQRALGASTNWLMSYVQSYFGLVFSPALIAYGLVRGRLLLTIAGSAGCLILYMISAQRTIIMLPLVLAVLYLGLRSRHRMLRSSSLPLIAFGAIILVCTVHYDQGVIFSLLAIYLVFRTLGVPGLSFSQYQDLFGDEGFTWWSHVKGMGLLVPPPPAYAQDPAWPQLGLLVGDRVYNSPEMNANANLFAGDGIAAAGALGVLVIGFVLTLWLVWLDRSAKGWNNTFAILVILPTAVALTNGQLFTTLLSFGGLFWMLMFHLYRRVDDNPGKSASAEGG